MIPQAVPWPFDEMRNPPSHASGSGNSRDDGPAPLLVRGAGRYSAGCSYPRGGPRKGPWSLVSFVGERMMRWRRMQGWGWGFGVGDVRGRFDSDGKLGSDAFGPVRR